MKIIKYDDLTDDQKHFLDILMDTAETAFQMHVPFRTILASLFLEGMSVQENQNLVEQNIFSQLSDVDFSGL